MNAEIRQRFPKVDDPRMYRYTSEKLPIVQGEEVTIETPKVAESKAVNHSRVEADAVQCRILRHELRKLVCGNELCSRKPLRQQTGMSSPVFRV